MIRYFLVLWIGLVFFAACDEGTAPPSEAPLEGEPAAEAPPVAQEPVAEPARETLEAPVAGGAGEGLREAGEALGEAIRAAAAAEGDSDCERAYNGAIAMVERMRLETGQEGTGHVPDRGAFVSACLELPPAAQRCMVMSHALEHREECARWRTDPRMEAMRERLREPSTP